MDAILTLPGRVNFQPANLELAGDACLRAALHSSSPFETVRYAQKAMGAYLLAAVAEPAIPEALERKAAIAERLEGLVSEHFLERGTDAGLALYALTHQDTTRGRTIVADIRRGNQPTSIVLSAVIGDSSFEYEITRIALQARQVIETYRDAMQRSANVFSILAMGAGMPAGYYDEYVEALRSTVQQLDAFIPVYTGFAEENSNAARSIQQILGNKSPQDFARLREDVINDLRRS